MRPRAWWPEGLWPAVGGLVAAACLTVSPLRAQESCRVEPPPPVPVCSVGGMLETVNPSRTGDVFGNLNPAAFAGGANADLMPGQASLSLSGGVNAGGAACARHLAARRSGGTVGVPGLDQGTIDMIESMSGEDLDVPVASGGTRRAVFEIFSPNVLSYEGGALGRPLSYRHGGVGGWPRNSGAHLVIALTDAGPGDLRAGRSYDARAVGSDGDGDADTLYTAWTGQIRPRPYLPPRDTLRREQELEKRREQEREKRACRKLRTAYLEMLEVSAVPLDSTKGREARDHDCSMDGVGQAGTRTTVPHAVLSGTVHIERITESRVTGRFDLSGTARVERERRSWSSRGPGRVDVDSARSDDTLRITGRFAAPNMRNTGFARAPLEVAQAPVDAAAPKETLRLVSHRPRRDETNVPWEAPGIRLGFDRPLDPASVTPSAVQLETGLADGQGGAVMAPVHSQPRLAGADTIVVSPRKPLRDGVRYRVTVRAGSAGIRGAEGEQMAVDRVWGFDTMVDLDDDERVAAGLAEHLERREGVESDTIQVATNAPLVRGKPTAFRVYAKWRADPQIAPGWQVLAFDANVRVRPDRPPEAPLIVPERRGVQIRRPDMYSAEERRKGENSVTLHGWRPDFEETRAVRTEIEPVRDCDTAPRVFSGVEELDWDPLDRDLDIGYVFAGVGPWMDSVPPGRRQEGAQAAQAAATFIEQLFPVGEARMRPAPAVAPFSPDFAESLAADIREIALAESVASTLDESVPPGWIDALTSYDGDSMTLLREAKAALASIGVVEPLWTRGDIRLTILRQMHNALVAADAYRDFDAVIVYMPFEWLQLLGVTQWDIGPRFMWPDAREPVRFTKPIIGMSLTGPGGSRPGIPSLAAITHEVGHVFGLEHNPDPDSEEERSRICDALKGTRMDGIEGLRMAPDGAGAALKSSEDGNAEHRRALQALMFPCTAQKDHVFITQSNYEKLLETMRPGAFEVPLPGAP